MILGTTINIHCKLYIGLQTYSRYVCICANGGCLLKMCFFCYLSLNSPRSSFEWGTMCHHMPNQFLRGCISSSLHGADHGRQRHTIHSTISIPTYFLCSSPLVSLGRCFHQKANILIGFLSLLAHSFTSMVGLERASGRSPFEQIVLRLLPNATIL